MKCKFLVAVLTVSIAACDSRYAHTETGACSFAIHAAWEAAKAEHEVARDSAIAARESTEEWAAREMRREALYDSLIEAGEEGASFVSRRMVNEEIPLQPLELADPPNAAGYFCVIDTWTGRLIVRNVDE